MAMLWARTCSGCPAGAVHLGCCSSQGVLSYSPKKSTFWISLWNPQTGCVFSLIRTLTHSELCCQSWTLDHWFLFLVSECKTSSLLGCSSLAAFNSNKTVFTQQQADSSCPVMKFSHKWVEVAKSVPLVFMHFGKQHTADTGVTPCPARLTTLSLSTTN